jgi:hypothetical protein
MITVMAAAIKIPPQMAGPAGLFWLFRLLQEPQRLWRRYLPGSLGFLGAIIRLRPSCESDRYCDRRVGGCSSSSSSWSHASGYSRSTSPRISSDSLLLLTGVLWPLVDPIRTREVSASALRPKTSSSDG